MRVCGLLLIALQAVSGLSKKRVPQKYERQGVSRRLKWKNASNSPAASALPLLLLIAQAIPAWAEASLDGVVMNATRQAPADPGTEVVLRGWLDGHLATLAKTTTGLDGSFRFTGLPTDVATLYLPGANQGGVHFPGQRVGLSREQNQASVQLTVYDPLQEPSPLVIRSHHVDVHPEDSVWRVREILSISNPTQTCYVGKASHEGGLPTTLQLHIPATFTRVTFDKEGFGRRFRVINEKLVTDIPWPPGDRELAFNYFLPIEGTTSPWVRPMDGLTDEVTVRIYGEHANLIQCNLPKREATAEHSEYGLASWTADARPIQVQLASPRHGGNYVRYAAVVLLLGLTLTVVVRSVGTARQSTHSTAEE